MAEALGRTELVRSVGGSDGYQLRYRLWTGSETAAATVVLLNGLMSHAAWFRPLIDHLDPAWRVVGADRRGSGLNREALGDAPSADALIDDVERIASVEHDDRLPLFIVGWCWGAALAVHAALVMAPQVSGLALAAPGLFLSERLKATAFEPLDNGLVRSPITEEMFTDGPFLDGFIRQDRDRLLAFTRRFADIVTQMRIAAGARLHRLEPPVLLLLAENDVATDNHRTRAAFERHVRHLAVTSCTSNHGMQFEVAPQMAKRIDTWIRSTGAC